MEGEHVLESLVGDQVERAAVRPALRVVEGRADAFRRLVDEHLDAAYRLAAVILGDRIEAEDAVHDAALAAWQHWGDLRDHDRFEAWLTRILVNECRDRLRARRRRRVVDVGRELAHAEHPRSPDTTDAVATREELVAALERLPPDERLLVVLRFYADRTVPSIAAITGTPEGTVKSRLHDAMRRLRAALEETDR